jgi:hypothetical protein
LLEPPPPPEPPFRPFPELRPPPPPSVAVTVSNEELLPSLPVAPPSGAPLPPQPTVTA